MRLLAQQAWLGGDTLQSNVLIEIADGVIKTVEADSGDDTATRLGGVALPGMVNAHSHAFHRALRGQTHRQGGDFWAWRDRMYEIAGQLDPAAYENLATGVFVEMALAGITTVGEFHYLHHRPDGHPYEDPNEMGHALVRAARRAGVRISLLDAGYFSAGFRDEPMSPVQRRFSDSDAERWLSRVADLATAYSQSNDVMVGLAPHSVRAVSERNLSYLAENRPPTTPIHIHLSEQLAENEACIEATGTTPTGLLQRVGLLESSTTAVHATHVTADDIAALGSSGTGVCYCATTERDLADGIGPSGSLAAAGVPLSVGSDSHATIDLFEEIRGIEFHERLRSGRRGVFAPSSLAEAATSVGASSLGFESGKLEVGRPGDLTVVTGESPRTLGSGDDVAGIVYAATSADVTDVFVGGKRIVSGGSHPEWERVRHVLA